MLWRFFQFRVTAAESKQFGDGHAGVGNRISTLDVIKSCVERKVRLLSTLGGKTHTQSMYLHRWTRHVST